MSVVFSINLRKLSKRPVGLDEASDEGLFLKGSSDSVIMLIHGLTGTPHEMGFPAQFLNKKGFTVVCPRLANHGAPLGILAKTEWQDFYSSARTAFLQIKDRYKKVYCAGLSMGALLALLLAEEFSDNVQAISCMSPTLFYDGWNTPKIKWILPFLYQTPLSQFFYFKEDSPYGLKNESMRKFVDRHYSSASLFDISGVDKYGYPFFPVKLLHQLQLLVKYLTPRLENITLPVQLIQAKDDDMTSIKNSLYIYERIKSKKKQLMLLDNSYHMVIADNEREHVAESINEFFETSI